MERSEAKSAKAAMEKEKGKDQSKNSRENTIRYCGNMYVSNVECGER